mgnify:CR=1 FL=1
MACRSSARCRRACGGRTALAASRVLGRRVEVRYRPDGRPEVCSASQRWEPAGERSCASVGAVCVVEHNVTFIKDLCTTAVFMSFGRILERGTVDELIASKALTELYFGV